MTAMKHKLTGIAAVLAAMLLVPVAAFADRPGNRGRRGSRSTPAARPNNHRTVPAPQRRTPGHSRPVRVGRGHYGGRHQAFRMVRVRVEAGYYELRTHRVLVEAGHYELRRIPAVERVVRGRFGRRRVVIVEPTRVQRLWVPDRYEVHTVRVWIPPRYEMRRVAVYRPAPRFGVTFGRGGITIGGHIRF